MCGSGTFVIEAAEIAAGLQAGRSRSFAFEQLVTFDRAGWDALRSVARRQPAVRFYGSDRDAGAIAMSKANAERAGVTELTEFRQLPVGELERPAGPPGLVIVNPPFGARIGEGASLGARSIAASAVCCANVFSGWRVGLITTEIGLARATALPFLPNGAPVLHGGLRVTLYRTDVLP